MTNRNVVVLALAVGLTGCGLLQKLKGGDKDAAPEAAPVASADTSDAGAAAAPEDAGAPAAAFANEKDVKRFPDEDKLEADEYATEWASTTPKTEPGTGAAVTTLPKGTKAKMLARRGHSVLVSFADPKDASRTLIGWVQEEAFVAGTAPPPAAATVGAAGGVKKPTGVCPTGLTLLIDTEPFCGKTCKTDKDCAAVGAGLACQGEAKTVTASGVGAPVTTCVKAKAAPKADAGAPVAKTDAGTSPPAPKPDAGATPAPTTTAAPKPDAGAGKKG